MLFKILNDNMEEDLAVAGILDEFSFDCFKFECNLIYLNPLTFKDILATQKVHLLFVESIWEGQDKKWGDINSSSDINMEALKLVVEYCKEKNVPTVFWNKEDPVHFYRFIDIARLFDFVFTTDENCIDTYIELLGHNKVFVLPFAAQPALHNPINRNVERLGKIAFAGSWHMYGHMRRKYDMEIVLKPSFKHGISIYDRNYLRNNISFRYPLEYEPYIKGGLPYNEIAEIYKKYDIFLNVNSVGRSPTMFSRRVFELLSCGTNVISGYSVGMENLFSGIVQLCKNEDDTEYFLDKLLNNSELRDRLSLLGQREIFKHHTYSHRLAYVLEKIGLKYITQDLPGVSIITWIDNPEDFNRCLRNYSMQRYSEKEIIIILRNSTEMAQEIEHSYKMKVLLSHEYATLEECLNKAISGAAFKYISFFNPHSYYGPEFVGDLINTFKYANADAVGKHTCYIYAKDSNKLYIERPDNEYRYSNFLNPHAMVMDKSALGRVKFTYSSEGPLISEMLSDSSLKMYAADRYNYTFESESISQTGVLKGSQDSPDNETIEIGCFEDYENTVTV